MSWGLVLVSGKVYEIGIVFFFSIDLKISVEKRVQCIPHYMASLEKFGYTCAPLLFLFCRDLSECLNARAHLKTT